MREGLIRRTTRRSSSSTPTESWCGRFGEQFQGGGHGIEIRNEGGEDFLYLCAYQEQRSIAKLSATGDQVWRQGAPMESGFYHKEEENYAHKKGEKPWGRNRFMPTNTAFHPDGSFYVADGYGAFRVLHYSSGGEWLGSFGKPGDDKKADGTFRLPHGIALDTRGDEPLVVVADRVNARLQWFTPNGEHRQTLDGFLLPANVAFHGDLMMVPDLVGRVTLLDRDNKIVAQLGKDTERVQEDQKKHGGFRLRGEEARWQDGKFIHPHDACFDAEGNIYVAEWVHRGRVTKMTRMG